MSGWGYEREGTRLDGHLVAEVDKAQQLLQKLVRIQQRIDWSRGEFRSLLVLRHFSLPRTTPARY